MEPQECRSSKIPTRPLGQTGHSVSILSLGGEATIEKKQQQKEAIKIINRALDLGVNYIDTSPKYGQGGSEKNIGEVMKTRRNEVFLASKTHGRTYDETMRLFENSLKRLNADYLDLYQIHNVQTTEEVKQIIGENGAIKAVEKLKSEGAVQNIGLTGHKSPDILLKLLKCYDFDCLLMAFSAADPHYQSFQKLLTEASERNLGIIAMKTAGVGRIFQDEGISSMKQALGYVWSHPVHTAIVGTSTLEELEENVQAARGFTPYSSEKLRELEKITKPYGKNANFYKIEW